VVNIESEEVPDEVESVLSGCVDVDYKDRRDWCQAWY
jgi:hypothetical protein